MKLMTLIVAVLVMATTSLIVGSAALAQSGASAPATGNIAVRDGINPGEVVVSWDAVPEATHYRIGYVNMVTGYPLAKSSVTGDWINAFIYVDENARNIQVSNGRAEYTIRRLDQGVRHAFTVLTSSNFVDTGGGGSVSSTFAWPPIGSRWEFHTVADRGGATAPSPSPPAAASLAAPSNFRASSQRDAVGNGIVRLSWDPVAGVSEYRVCRQKRGDVGWTCGWDNDPRYQSTFSSLDPGVAYEFAIRSASSRENPRGVEPRYSQWVFASASVPVAQGCPDDEICDDLSNTVLANLWLRLWEEQDFSGNHHIEVSAAPYFDVDAYRLDVIVRSGRYSADYCNTSDLFAGEGYTQMGCSPLNARLADVTGVSANAEMYTDGGLRCARHSGSTIEELRYACVWRTLLRSESTQQHVDRKGTNETVVPSQQDISPRGQAGPESYQP